jgi:hypothetical protein
MMIVMIITIEVKPKSRALKANSPIDIQTQISFLPYSYKMLTTFKLELDYSKELKKLPH